MDFTDDNPFNASRNATRLSRKDLYDNKLRVSKEVNNKVKRMLTSDFVKKNLRESSSASKLYKNPSFRQQLDCLSNLQINAETSSVKKRGVSSIVTDKNGEKTDKTRTGGLTGTMISANDPRGTFQSNISKTQKEKKAKIDIYQDLGSYFNNDKP